MAPNDSAQATDEARDPGAGRRKAARYLVPVGVAGVAAATIGLVPALAAAGDPSLPKISAQQLIEKMAASDTQQLSGTMKITTDLGLPGLGSLGSFAPKGGGSDKSASPDAKLTELASGTHTLRIAADGPDRQKVSILEDAAEYSLIHDGNDVWAYDSGSNQVFHSQKSAAGAAGEHGKKAPDAGVPTTPKALADQFLKNVDPTTAVSVDGTAQVAGRDAYQLLIKPKQSGSTIGSVRIAVDAKTGVPLKFTLSPSAGGKAVVDAGFTKVDFSKPSADTFRFSPPKGAKVTEDDGKQKQTYKPEQGLPGGLGNLGDAKNTKVIGKGWTAIAELDTGGKGMPKADNGEGGGDAQKFLDSLGDKVSGKFGTGTVFKTRLVNALITDNGKVYVGAVTKDALIGAANSAK
ncbi:LolA family protein [Streptomyces sp. WM6378]|uniref:LolA family protein n=1 Tax=Streptomyces sp. WM6378 TaxID=1415557 RepID=UPI0006ADDE5A|nr:outer membrane lipoprotein carrier protein LolA [Streptomyces sp. WM6378]KOU53590.1 membrane protein [Streptomyces sp. WM6378]